MADVKRKCLTLVQKVEVLKQLDNGSSIRKIAAVFNVGKTQISSVRANRESVKRQWENGGRADSKTLKKRKTTYEDLNTAVWEWFCAARAKNLPVTGKLIQEKALMLSVESGHDDFSASNGWLDSWRKAHNVKFAALSGESAEVPLDAVDDWTRRIPDITEGYDLKDVFNMDETGLYFRALPKQSMVRNGESCKGTKLAKERVTVLLACSATGEKLKPLVIGRAQNPRCLKNVEKSSMPVIYRWNRKAWMTGTICEEWLLHLNTRMQQQKRKILLLLDNCGAHPHMELSNVRLQFLPPNTTSKLQPLDAGIICNVKALYRKRLLRHLLAEMDESNSAADLVKSVNLLHAIRWLDLAWEGVKAKTITKCFAKCGLAQPTTGSENEGEEETLPPLEEPCQQLLDGTQWEEFVQMDNDAATVDDLISTPAPAAKPDTDEEEESEKPVKVISSKQALEMTSSLLAFVTQTGQPELVSAALKLRAGVEDIIIREKGKAKQKNITDFFNCSCRSP